MMEHNKDIETFNSQAFFDRRRRTGIMESKGRLIQPCIRLARGKFELTNQDSAGGKNSSVLLCS